MVTEMPTISARLIPSVLDVGDDELDTEEEEEFAMGYDDDLVVLSSWPKG